MARDSYPVGSSRAVSDEEERLTGKVIGSAMEVHRVLGPGFLESIYHEALLHQLMLDGLCARSEMEIAVPFKGIEAGRQRLDVVVEGRLILELKAVSDITGAHKAQLRSYLKATKLRLGLLINFDQELLQVKRVLNG